MPPKPHKKLQSLLSNINECLQQADAWSLHGDYVKQSHKLLGALSELEEHQMEFRVVDADAPWDVKASRLLAWLKSHPKFESKAVEMVNTLPVERGVRGVVLREPLKKDESAFKIPQPCMLSTATAVRTKDLGKLIQDERLQLADLPTVVLALHLMVEHTKGLVVAAGSKADITADIPVPVADYAPLPAGTIMPGRAKDAHGNGHAGHDEGEGHAQESSHDSHGHSHGGKACHGHGEPPASNNAHGHSHGGKPCHGHGEPPATAHGHSHGGKPCHGHGDHEDAGEPMIVQSLDVASHPWGSAFRAYIATLPDKPTSCLYFTGAQLARLSGFPIQHEIATFIRNTAQTYLRLYTVFGVAAGSMIAGFEEYFTWSHFKWAISCAMSRQNKVPNSVDGGFSMALVPLYDMVNATPGPITSFFFGEEQYLVLDAVRDFAAGEELVMSYGDRDGHKMLQFSGFVIEEQMPNDHALVEACLAGVDKDALFKIRINVLNSLFISPEHNAQRYLRTPELAQQARAISQSLGKDSKNAIDQLIWSQPFMFQVKADGTLSVDLISFMRVAAITNKADAAEALKQCDAARRTIIAKREEAHKRQEEKAAKRLADRATRKDAPASADADASDEDDDEYIDFQLALNVLSPGNELLAYEMLVGMLNYTVTSIEDVETVAAAGYDPVEAYRQSQLAILKRAMKQATDVLLPARKAAGLM